MPHGLHLNYDVDFRSRRVGDIAPTLTSLLLPHLISNILKPEEAPLPQGPPPQEPPSQESPLQEPPPQGPLPQESPPIKDQDTSSERPPKPDTPTILRIKYPFRKKAMASKESPEDESPS